LIRDHPREPTSSVSDSQTTTREEAPSEEGGLLIFVAWLLLVVGLLAGFLIIGEMGNTGPSYAREIHWPGIGLGVGLVVQGVVSFAVLSGLAGVLRHAAAIRHAIAPPVVIPAPAAASGDASETAVTGPLPAGVVAQCAKCHRPLSAGQARSVKGQHWCMDHLPAP
jgi:hypothetical protein